MDTLELVIRISYSTLAENSIKKEALRRKRYMVESFFYPSRNSSTMVEFVLDYVNISSLVVCQAPNPG